MTRQLATLGIQKVLSPRLSAFGGSRGFFGGRARTGSTRVQEHHAHRLYSHQLPHKLRDLSTRPPWSGFLVLGTLAAQLQAFRWRAGEEELEEESGEDFEYYDEEEEGRQHIYLLK